MKKHPRLRKIVKRLAFFVLVMFAISVCAGSVMIYALVRTLPDPSRISERAIPESTKILDRTGKTLLYEIHGEERRTRISLAEIPRSVVQATIAAEDVHFYQHGGLDLRGILRAIITNLRTRSIAQGGSTITQQLIKNSLLGPEQTFQRKIREQVLAVLLERKYSKDEILELYLNQIPYGSNAYGVAAAAETYFGKSASELTLDESALIAALPKAPTYYSPYGSHKEDLISRRNRILDRMATEGFIRPEEASSAKGTRLSVIPPKNSIRAPHFVMYVREYLQDKYGEDVLEQGGLRVTTTLDVEFQAKAEEIIKDGVKHNEEIAGAANASMVAIDPKSGEILALVGSKDFWGKPEPEGCKPGINCRFDPHVNIATRSRQPGSSFKPFVYATALKKGYTPETVLFDVPTEFNTYCNVDGTPGPFAAPDAKCYHPQNYDNDFRGPVSLRQALAQSLNIPSVKLLYLVGSKDAIETAQSMGISTLKDPDRYGLSLVLGGAEVNLLEMTSAFGTFSQDGILHQKNAILRIEDSRGVVMEEKKDIATPVLDSEVARTMNDMLSDNDARQPVFSPTTALYFPGMRVAAKTGTTQDYRDAWTIGYTPNIVVGVWVGNSDNTPMRQSGPSVLVAAPLWRKFMEFAMTHTPPGEFIAAAPREVEKPILRGEYNVGGGIRSILTLVNKEDPLGPPPANPWGDPQYSHWQTGIDQWLTTHAFPITGTVTASQPPASPQANISLSLPSAPLVKGARQVPITIRATNPVKEVTLFMNNTNTGSRLTSLVAGVFMFPLNDPLGPGQYYIRVLAKDESGNQGAIEQTISVIP